MILTTSLVQHSITSILLLFGVFAMSMLFLAIISTKTIQRNGRILMSLNSIALILSQVAALCVSMSKVFEVQIRVGKSTDLSVFLLVAHVAGKGFASFIFVIMAIDQYLSAGYSSWPNRALSLYSTIVACLLAISFAVLIAYLYFIYKLTTYSNIIMIGVDVAAAIFLVIAWRKSIKKYKKLFGQGTLTERYQLFETSNWTSTVMPSAICATALKVVCILIIMFMGILPGSAKNTALFVYYFVDYTKTFLYVFIIVRYHKRIKKKYLTYLSKFCCFGAPEAEVNPETLERELHLNHNDYFKMLHAQWK